MQGVYTRLLSVGGHPRILLPRTRSVDTIFVVCCYSPFCSTIYELLLSSTDLVFLYPWAHRMLLSPAQHNFYKVITQAHPL